MWKLWCSHFDLLKYFNEWYAYFEAITKIWWLWSEYFNVPCHDFCFAPACTCPLQMQEVAIQPKNPGDKDMNHQPRTPGCRSTCNTGGIHLWGKPSHVWQPYVQNHQAQKRRRKLPTASSINGGSVALSPIPKQRWKPQWPGWHCSAWLVSWRMPSMWRRQLPLLFLSFRRSPSSQPSLVGISHKSAKVKWAASN